MPTVVRLTIICVILCGTVSGASAAVITLTLTRGLSVPTGNLIRYADRPRSCRSSEVPVMESAYVPTGNLIRYADRPRSCRSSEVPVMESANHRLRLDRTESGRFHRPCDRTVFPQSEVGPDFMVVPEVAPKHLLQMPLT
jgi:hypothetical protein